MSSVPQNGHLQTLRFGVFDMDLRTQELRKHGTRVKLPRQSFQILHMLLERPGELVTREELQKTLWPSDTFVDFDHGLNNAVKRIRAAIGDSAEAPHWIETLPRLGYRFIGTVEPPNNGHAPAAALLPSVSSPLSNPASTATLQPYRKSRWPWLLGIAALTLVLGVAAVRYRSHERWLAAGTLEISPFTSYPGFEFAPTFSPDGNQIAFAWTGSDQSEVYDLYVKVVGTETPVQLTHDPAAILIPAWSPDGRFIAFYRGGYESPNQSGVFLIPSVGGPEHRLRSLPFAKHVKEGGLAWSSDGKWIIFPEPEEKEFHSQLVALNIETLEQRRLPKPANDCAAAGLPAVSPDGQSLAFACMFDFGLSGLYVQPWLAGAAREILRVKGGFEGLSWAMDGRSLVYTLGTDLWRIPLRHGAAPERLWFGQNALGAVIARRGSRMAFTHMQTAADIWRIPLTPSRGNADRAVRLAPSDLTQQSAQYSPDGKRVAFESMRSGTPEVWVCNADGTDLLRLTSFGGPLTGTPHWSPDSRFIVLDSRASGKAELYTVSADGGTPHILPTLASGGSVPFWSHDGAVIYFASEIDGVPQLFKIPAHGGTAVQLTHGGGLVSRETPDGKHLYYMRPSGGAEIWSVGTDGRDEKRVEGLPAFKWPAWDLTSAGLYYYDVIPGSHAISFFSFATKQIHEVIQTPGRPAPYASNLSVSPDGKDLLYTQSGPSTADIVLVDNFR
jgi:Tol biopolymer transport system component/DNA-binding winged helix-turn-helix (wHTH) protein